METVKMGKVYTESKKFQTIDAARVAVFLYLTGKKTPKPWSDHPLFKAMRELWIEAFNGRL